MEEGCRGRRALPEWGGTAAGAPRRGSGVGDGGLPRAGAGAGAGRAAVLVGSPPSGWADLQGLPRPEPQQWTLGPPAPAGEGPAGGAEGRRQARAWGQARRAAAGTGEGGAVANKAAPGEADRRPGPVAGPAVKPIRAARGQAP